MAVFADIGRKRVSRVLAGRCDAIVAVDTAACDVGMVEVGGQPASRRMTVFAKVTARNMRRRLAGRRDPVVATTTVADDAGVIEISGHPSSRRMTVVAGVAAGDVRCCFASCYGPVMTAATVTDDLCMVHGVRRQPADHAMTILADAGRLNMCRVFPRGISAVVTARAIAGDIDVVKVRRYPAHAGMTVVTGFTACYMRRRFAGRDVAVVTRLTCA